VDPGFAIAARPIANNGASLASGTPLAPILSSAANAAAIRNMRLTLPSIRLHGCVNSRRLQSEIPVSSLRERGGSVSRRSMRIPFSV
jgi:hypothetical protein